MDTLTFSDLRKIQKEEKRTDELTELDEDFLLRANEYLQRKKENGGDRDYSSSKRVFRKIIALREQKVIKNARLSLKSNIKASELNLLPREQELFRETKEIFEQHRDRVNDIRTNVEKMEDTEDQEDETDEAEEIEEDEPEEEIEDVEDGYSKVCIISEVPEFMGTDLEEYGPFEEGDKPIIPDDNAEILVNRGNAEEV